MYFWASQSEFPHKNEIKLLFYKTNKLFKRILQKQESDTDTDAKDIALETRHCLSVLG